MGHAGIPASRAASATAAFAACVAELLDHPLRAAEMGAAAAERARGYTWSVAAARLRTLYGDLTSRALVECP